MCAEVEERFPRASGTMIIACLLVLAVFTASGVVPLVEANSEEARGQNLVVLLIDGYGSALFNRTNERVQYGMRSLMAQGTHAQYMRPVFPTQSYPNWRSLVTEHLRKDGDVNLNELVCMNKLRPQAAWESDEDFS